MERAENPKKVVNALKHALMNTVPCIRYRPGLQSLLVFPLSLTPARLTDRILALVTGAPKPPTGVRK